MILHIKFHTLLLCRFGTFIKYNLITGGLELYWKFPDDQHVPDDGLENKLKPRRKELEDSMNGKHFQELLDVFKGVKRQFSRVEAGKKEALEAGKLSVRADETQLPQADLKCAPANGQVDTSRKRGGGDACGERWQDVGEHKKKRCNRGDDETEGVWDQLSREAENLVQSVRSVTEGGAARDSERLGAGDRGEWL